MRHGSQGGGQTICVQISKGRSGGSNVPGVGRVFGTDFQGVLFLVVQICCGSELDGRGCAGSQPDQVRGAT